MLLLGEMMVFALSHSGRPRALLLAVLVGSLLGSQGCQAIVCDGDGEAPRAAASTGGAASGGSTTLGISIGDESLGGLGGAGGSGGLGGMGGADRDLPEPTCFCSLR